MGGSTGVQSFSENYGTAKSIPDPVRTGYTFSSWVKSDRFTEVLIMRSIRLVLETA